MSPTIPCVFGYISLGAPRIYFRPPEDIDTLYKKDEYVSLYKIGASDEMHSYVDETRVILIFGRI